MTYADRIEQKRKRHQDELVALDREATIAAALPVEPYIIHCSSYHRVPTIAYKVNTLADARSIIAAYPEPMDISARQSGCLSIAPDSLHHKDYADVPSRWEVYQGICVRQHGGKGFYTASVEFWTVVNGDIGPVHVSIEVAQFPHKYRARIKATYDNQGNVHRAEFIDSDIRHDFAAERVKYSGGSEDAFDIRYYFSALDCFDELVTASQS